VTKTNTTDTVQLRNGRLHYMLPDDLSAHIRSADPSTHAVRSVLVPPTKY